LSGAITTKRPLVIAHRGASGYLPEHTLAAKALAHSQGADFLEQDVVATRDGQLIVCHDVYLERVTDVKTRYPARHRTDGHFYAIDFDWHEIRTLRRLGDDSLTKPAQAPDGIYADAAQRICALAEEIEFIHSLNRAQRHSSGIYVEIKNPRWHREQGCDITSTVLRVLADCGYANAADPIFLQCFDAVELRRVREELGSSLRLVQLVGRGSPPELLASGGLERIAEYATALGPNYRLLLDVSDTDELVMTPLVSEARRAGLLLHPYTFNRDAIPAYAETLEELLALAYRMLVPDAVFCDYPDVAVQVRDCV